MTALAADDEMCARCKLSLIPVFGYGFICPRCRSTVGVIVKV